MLKSRLPLIAAELAPRVQVALRAGAELMAEGARARVQVGEPDVHLRDHIHVQPGGGGYYVLAGDDEVFYGHMVEFGTSHSAPHPFLIPTFEEKRDEVVNLAAAAIRSLA